jgi:hypothetical protein
LELFPALWKDPLEKRGIFTGGAINLLLKYERHIPGFVDEFRRRLLRLGHETVYKRTDGSGASESADLWSEKEATIIRA